MWPFLLLLLQIYNVYANTEKVIFLGPSSLQVPVEHPTLEDLNLEALSPQHWTLRTHIRAEFPTNSSKHGEASWYLLHRLEEGKRYEVRICWAATVSTHPQVSPHSLFCVATNVLSSRYIRFTYSFRNSRTNYFPRTILGRAPT